MFELLPYLSIKICKRLEVWFDALYMNIHSTLPPSALSISKCPQPCIYVLSGAGRIIFRVGTSKIFFAH